MEKRENKDGKLVRLAQSGDNDAMEQLCAEYKDTVRMLARPYFLIGADRDDLIQEGMICTRPYGTTGRITNQALLPLRSCA